jgi:lipoyl(octanoyl) transferase
MDLEPVRRINPRGYEGLQVVTLAELGGPSAMESVKPALLEHLARQFTLTLQTAAALPDLQLPEPATH